MTQNLFLLGIILFPGLLAEQYYERVVKEEAFSLSVATRIVIISLLSYVFRGMIGVIQGYGDANVMVYFQTVDNIVKYVIVSLVSGFLLVNSLIFLEQVMIPICIKIFSNLAKEERETDGK